MRQTPLSGIELYNWCTSELTDIANGCRAYMVGFGEGLVLGQQLNSNTSTVICMPVGITPPQMQLMLQKTAKAYPELLNQEAAVIAAKTIIEAYRCRPGQTPGYGQKPNRDR